MSEAKQRDQWRHTSQLLALTANCNRDPKKQREPFTSDDFNPFSEVNTQPQKTSDISVLKMFLKDQ